MNTSTRNIEITIGDVVVSNNRPFSLISGPCQIESSDHCLEMAGQLKEISDKVGVGFIFKSSFDKANRTSILGKRGVGFEVGLSALENVRRQINCPVLTDIHEPSQCNEAAGIVDILQIPAFLCRQTDLLIAAGKTGAAINIKKGQFLAPWDMQQVVTKVASTGNEKILLCERGTSFGYNTLINDMRSLSIMADFGYPIVIDATHSVQQPGGLGSSSGGQREFAPLICRAAVAVGVAAVFIESHENPDSAPSDGPNMMPLSQMEQLISDLHRLDSVAKSIIGIQN